MDEDLWDTYSRPDTSTLAGVILPRSTTEAVKGTASATLGTWT